MVSFAEAWISGSIFALVVIIIRCLTKRRLPQFFFYWLWNITMFMFLVPVRVQSLFSVYNLFPRVKTSGKVLISQLATKQADFLNAGNAAASVAMQEEQSKILLIIWLVGMAVCALYFVSNRAYWTAKLHDSKPMDAEIPMTDSACKLRLSANVGSPCVFGFFKPKIIFPNYWDFSDSSATELAIRHEQSHIVHFDNIRKSALSLLLCIQWFNPIAWLVFIFANKDMEMYCDSCVIAEEPPDLRQFYAGMLLRRRTTPAAASPIGLFVNQKTALRERIVFIMTDKKPKKTLAIISIICMVILFSAFATVSIPLIYPQDAGTAILRAPNEKMVEEPYVPLVQEYSGDSVNIKNGDFLLIDSGFSDSSLLTLSIVPVEGYNNGQIAEYGYVKDGNYIRIGEERLSDGTVLDFSQKPADADSLYIRNYCCDTLHFSSL